MYETIAELITTIYRAGIKLMAELKAVVVEAAAILELAELKGREKLGDTPLHALAIVSEYGERQWEPLKCVSILSKLH